jgi:serine/threonine-protein kinase
MALEIGSRLGHYDVTALIGEGGMGQVYQATDTKLNRQVALKILPEAFASDPDRLARFQREAQVLASLNHPGIAAIYGLEESGDTRALVLELVEGPTLADRIAQGPIPVDEALPIAKQIAEALEAAHEAGVIHRDLKPANIKVRDDGTVKVLDFGLAKALDNAPEGDPSLSPTLTAAATQMGVIMGTAAYMSPEQAAGKPADRGADVWAFGAVLFEMLAGQQLFGGETVSHVLASVLKTDPDWTILPENTPASLKKLLWRCLERNAKQRLRDVREARIGIEEAATAPPAAETVPSVPAIELKVWQRPMPAALGLLAAMAIAALVVWSLGRPGTPIESGATHFEVQVEGGHEMPYGECPRLTVSPDGRVLAYIASGQLHLRRLDSLDSVAMPGTAEAESPFFSPDGRSVGFVQRGVLRSMSVDGGLITEIAAVAAANYSCAGASWSPDGTIVYRPAGSAVLFSVPAAGGTPQPLTTIRDPAVEMFHIWPQVIDGGQRVLFTVLGPSAVWEDSRIVVEDLDTGERTVVVQQGTYGRYVPTGHIVYATASGTLFALPYDLARGEPTGERFPVASGVRVAALFGAASFAVSDAGTAAFVHGSTWTRQLLWWVDRGGRRVRQLGAPLASIFLDLSPDGRRLAVDLQQPANSDIFLIDVATGRRERFTFGQGFDSAPAWSADGSQLAYVTYSPDGIFIQSQGVGDEGSAIALYTPEADTDLWAWSWSPDGWLAFYEAEGGDNDAYALRVDDPETPIGVAVSEANEVAPQFSPDGRWLAYSSDGTGRDEVYVVSFPEIGRKEQVSTEGGYGARWSAAGDELFFWSGTTLMVSDVSPGESFSWGTPRPLFEVPDITEDFAYDVAPDGEHFVLGVRNPEAVVHEIHVVLNWTEELTRLVPTN